MKPFLFTILMALINSKIPLSEFNLAKKNKFFNFFLIFLFRMKFLLRISIPEPGIIVVLMCNFFFYQKISIINIIKYKMRFFLFQ